MPRYAVGPEGGGKWVESPTELPELNAEQVTATSDKDVSELSKELEAEVEAVLHQVAGYGENPPSFRFHGGGVVEADVALGILLGELVVHGWDIANAIRKPWSIDPRHVGLIATGLSRIAPGWVDPKRAGGLSARFDLRIRGAGRQLWTFNDGRLEVATGGTEPVDVHISADSTAFVLVFYRRKGLWPYVLTGKLIAWGRRPWLALTLPSRFHNP